MSDIICHGQFTLERTYKASPERVYEAWSDVSAKAHWFIGPEGWHEVRREMDFRVGGYELLEGRFENGRTTLYQARFHALSAARRIVLVFDMHLSEVHHSTSLVTVEFSPAGRGTHLRFTEHVAFLDGTTSASNREHGTAVHLDRLTTCLSKSP
jgi:uncharacterized protein YndB with AHSA1/START domain